MCTQRLAEERGVSPSDFIRSSNDGRKVHWQLESERLWAIPYAVGGLIDLCFRTMPAKRAGEFAVAAIESICVGADLSLVPARFALDLLVDDEGSGAYGVLRHTGAGSPEYGAVERVISLFRRRIAGDDPTDDAWDASAIDAQMAYSIVTDVTLAAKAAVYTAFAAAAAHSAFYYGTSTKHFGWVEAEAPDAAAYAAFIDTCAPDAMLIDIVDGVGNAVSLYGDPPYAYKDTPYPFVENADATVAAACDDYYQWRADRLIQHLSQAPVNAVNAVVTP